MMINYSHAIIKGKISVVEPIKKTRVFIVAAEPNYQKRLSEMNKNITIRNF